MYALAHIGIDILNLVNYALSLQDYQYNGFEPGFSRYSRRGDALKDLLTVVMETKRAISIYFPKLEVISEKIDSLFASLQRGK
ncbi:hypothetical protein YN1HA_18480 [Sulfurisphaera ohwakuensis]